MRYLGLDVHSKTTAWCLLDAAGEQLGRGKAATTVPALTKLVENLSAADELVVGQEVGTMSYFVHDVAAAAGSKILSFNAQQLRMIASSRKKTDRRDAWWIAKALQTGMYPHPVYIPLPPIRRLRSLLSQRQAVVRARQAWVVRARSYLRAAGETAVISRNRFPSVLAELLERPCGADEHLVEGLELCHRQIESLQAELNRLNGVLANEVRDLDEVRRLVTVPGIGPTTAVTVYAWVGDVSRFSNARALCSYAGLVPSVWQSGESTRMGHITKQGSPMLRKVMVEAAQAMYGRCRSEEAEPLKAIADRVYTRSHRKKIAIVATGRHMLRIAYYILRDGTEYQPELLARAGSEKAA